MQAPVGPGLVATLAVWLTSCLTASAVLAAPLLTLARPVDQARFTATTFATGLSFPTSMAELADGSVLVAESAGTSLFASTSGRLVRLVDADGDGVADGPPQVLAAGIASSECQRHVPESPRRVGAVQAATRDLQSLAGG